MYTLKSRLECLESFLFENNNVHFSSSKCLSGTMVWKLAKVNFFLKLYLPVIFPDSVSLTAFGLY